MAGGAAIEGDAPDRTFGPEVVFCMGNQTDAWNQSPRSGNQFFGHMAIPADGALTVTLHDGTGISTGQATSTTRSAR